jgi:hypothetical protein
MRSSPIGKGSARVICGFASSFSSSPSMNLIRMVNTAAFRPLLLKNETVARNSPSLTRRSTRLAISRPRLAIHSCRISCVTAPPITPIMPMRPPTIVAANAALILRATSSTTASVRPREPPPRRAGVLHPPRASRPSRGILEAQGRGYAPAPRPADGGLRRAPLALALLFFECGDESICIRSRGVGCRIGV